MKLFDLSAAQAARAIRDGELGSEELVTACLGRIAEREASVGAWAHLDADLALQRARDADTARRSGTALGPLHGVPVGVKDVFDTHDLPTEDGTPLHAGRTPAYDAAAVAALRAAGAVILGKTVTAELAVCTPGKTRNPHDPNRTPGGSSSGSAAAVADRMVPLAIGTQTNGSVIRPAAFCGIVGYKPTYGLISRYRVLSQSRLLDQVGVFARTVEDAALLAETLIGHDERDPDTRPRARPRLADAARQGPPVPPRFAFVKTPAWAQAEDDTREAFGELTEYLGPAVDELDLDRLMADAVPTHRTIMEADLARSFRREYERSPEAISAALREIIERGRQCLAMDYRDAVDRIAPLNQRLEDLLLEYDAILTPATPGEAPAGLASTGNPVFCTPWTLCGVPAVTLPLLQGASGMPIGVQLVSARHDDARLLRTAAWLAHKIAESGEAT
jgi:Asp-tRNA(Asn)/Glu-tRNA(Gln) amidotransferase A subunit family amidase